ncbi:enoyl-CoA hydratase/isomerase family protein [Alcaligenaceae bacterium]|nr:enoyl-CoA hydratase/isomerase family protein [Alcaligenaceae bacterium]
MLDMTIEGGLATVVLNRPPANAINVEWLNTFDLMIETMARRSDVSVVHLRSAQKVFCAGADLRLMSESLGSPEGVDVMMNVVERMQHTFDNLSRLPQVTLAEIGGAALGGGFELALACDLRIISEGAMLGLPEASLGLLPGAGGTQRLTQLVGPGLATQLILGAETINGVRAMDLHLVHWAYATDMLPGQSLKLARRLASMPPLAIAAGKRCIAAALTDRSFGLELERNETRALYESHQTQALVRQFIEKQTLR